MERVEANVDIFAKARKKFEKCSYSLTSPHLSGYCKVYLHTFDKSFDFMTYCINCRTNRDDPTTHVIPVRKG